MVMTMLLAMTGCQLKKVSAEKKLKDNLKQTQDSPSFSIQVNDNFKIGEMTFNAAVNENHNILNDSNYKAYTNTNALVKK